MTISYSSLRNLVIVLLAAAVCALGYMQFLRPDKPAEVAEVPVLVEVPPLEPAFQRLSALVDAHIQSIFSALDGKMPPIPHHELRLLRENFADASANATEHQKSIYRTAIQVCDALLAAIQERERASASLADTRSKAYGVALSQDSKKEEEEKRKFFEVGIAKRWADNSKAHREKVLTLYDRLRAEERQILAGAPAKSAVHEPDTIVLKSPTNVRLRYGNATLPAGLSLRVVRRADKDVVVDYAGEHLTLPKP